MHGGIISHGISLHSFFARVGQSVCMGFFKTYILTRTTHTLSKITLFPFREQLGISVELTSLEISSSELVIHKFIDKSSTIISNPVKNGG